MYTRPRETTAPEIKAILAAIGYDTYSVTKTKRMVGGAKYNFHGTIRTWYGVGDARYYYSVFLLSPEDDRNVAVYALREAGLKVKDWRNGAIEVTLPDNHTTKRRVK